MRSTIQIFLFTLLAAFASTVIHVSAQSRFTISASTGRGGSSSTGGTFTMTGTIGQSEVGSVTNGVYIVGGGFWAVVQTSDAPALSIERLANGGVRLFWAKTAHGFLLQEIAAVAPGTPSFWTLVGSPYQTNATHVSITVPTPTGSRLFRLRKP